MTAEDAITYFDGLINDGILYGVSDVRNILDSLSVVDVVANEDAMTILYSGEGDVIKQIQRPGDKVRLLLQEQLLIIQEFLYLKRWLQLLIMNRKVLFSIICQGYVKEEQLLLLLIDYLH